MTNQETAAINRLIMALNSALGRIDKLSRDTDYPERKEADQAIAEALAAVQGRAAPGPNSDQFVQLISPREGNVWALTKDGRVYLYSSGNSMWVELDTKQRSHIG